MYWVYFGVKSEDFLRDYVCRFKNATLFAIQSDVTWWTRWKNNWWKRETGRMETRLVLEFWGDFHVCVMHENLGPSFLVWETMDHASSMVFQTKNASPNFLASRLRGNFHETWGQDRFPIPRFLSTLHFANWQHPVLRVLFTLINTKCVFCLRLCWLVWTFLSFERSTFWVVAEQKQSFYVIFQTLTGSS